MLEGDMNPLGVRIFLAVTLLAGSEPFGRVGSVWKNLFGLYIAIVMLIKLICPCPIPLYSS
ncbi:hypothetical protein Ptc2401_01562 [Prosthecochloris sp. CIB 2401]|nr:hypothetical protein Ptc2401_01562 [Prosthecochloris sp. CIB 2401]